MGVSAGGDGSGSGCGHVPARCPCPGEEHCGGGEDCGGGGDEGDLPAGHAAGQGSVDPGRAGQWRVLVPAGRQWWQLPQRGLGGPAGPGEVEAKAAGAAARDASMALARTARTLVRRRMVRVGFMTTSCDLPDG